MQWYTIVILSAYACLLAALVVMKSLKIGNRRRGVVKMLATATFTTVGIIGSIRQGGGLHLLLAAAIVCAFAGDLFLVFMDNRKWFVAGVVSFSFTAALMAVYSIITYGFYWWSLIPFILTVSGSAIAQARKCVSFGKNVVLLNIYCVMIAACGGIGFSLVCNSFCSISMLLCGLGCFLYFTSDVCLGLYLSKFRNRFVDCLNTATYFPGLMLIALSVFL